MLDGHRRSQVSVSQNSCDCIAIQHSLCSHRFTSSDIVDKTVLLIGELKFIQILIFDRCGWSLIQTHFLSHGAPEGLVLGIFRFLSFPSLKELKLQINHFCKKCIKCPGTICLNPCFVPPGALKNKEYAAIFDKRKQKTPQLLASLHLK